MSHGPFLRAFRELGVVETFRTINRMRTIKFGDLIGVDKIGNKYYENRVDYPNGQHRWVVYAHGKNFYEVDASHVPAEWHGWLHNVTDEPPTETTTGSTHRVEPQKNAYGSSAPYARNLGGVISAHYPNLSQVRPRGYGLGNGVGSAPNEEAFYTQPGWPLDKRNKIRFESTRKSRVGFTLKDNPLTLAAKAAARTGLSLDEYRAFTDDSSPTKALLQLTGTSVGRAEAEALIDEAGADSTDAEVLLAGAYGIPDDAGKRQLAAALARGLPVDGMATFAAEAASLLTPAEEELLSEGVEMSAMLDLAMTQQRYIDDYKDVKGIKGVAEGIASAVAKRDSLLAKVEALKVVEAKMATLADKYDARAYDMARQAVQDSVQALDEEDEVDTLAHGAKMV